MLHAKLTGGINAQSCISRRLLAAAALALAAGCSGNSTFAPGQASPTTPSTRQIPLGTRRVPARRLKAPTSFRSWHIRGIFLTFGLRKRSKPKSYLSPTAKQSGAYVRSKNAQSVARGIDYQRY